MPYPQFTKIVMQYWSEEDDGILIQYGKSLLDLMLRKVANQQLQNEKKYNQRKNTICQYIIDTIEMSTPNHFLQCLGLIWRQGQYQKIPLLQKQLLKMLQIDNSQQSIRPNQSFNSYILNNSKTTTSSIRKDLSKQVSSKSSNTYTHKSNNYYQDSVKFQNNESDEQSRDNDQQLFMNQLTNISSIKSPISKISRKRQNDISSIHSNSKPQSFYNSDLNVQTYLKMKVSNYNSQLNLVNQKFKLNLGNWEQLTSGNQYIQSNKILVPALYSGTTTKIIEGQGIGKNKKQAKTQASLQILRKLYEQYPKIFQQIQRIKDKQSLTT